MPGYAQPVGRNGALPPWWNALMQTIQGLQAQVNQLTSGQQSTVITDACGNAIVVIGQLAQTVTIGAAAASSSSLPVAGVLVGTGLGGIGQVNAGIAVQQSLAIGKIALTAGQATATISTVSGAFAAGMMIGAADVSDPTTGVATPAIAPGTSIQSVNGSTVTLTNPLVAPVAESGPSLYCAAAFWRSLQTLT